MRDRIKVLVTGAGGQVGSAVGALASAFPSIEFFLFSREELDITDAGAIEHVFSRIRPDWCINAAAYTLVDKAETEQDKARLLNATAVGMLAGICKTHGTSLIHISTDYVFNGRGNSPYKVSDAVDPVNAYGATKAEGERLALQNGGRVYIIRTSWVYGKVGNNFVKTMKRLMAERESVNVVNDQVGSPTNAHDLAEMLVRIILSDPAVLPGVYHFSNSGVTTWYEFACAIREITGSGCTVNPVSTSAFPTPARRPSYSVMDLSKIADVLHVEIPDWKGSLRKFLSE